MGRAYVAGVGVGAEWYFVKARLKLFGHMGCFHGVRVGFATYEVYVCSCLKCDYGRAGLYCEGCCVLSSLVGISIDVCIRSRECNDLL